MWHEARRQERKIRGLMVDYKRRAERRREYYEKIKQDPTQFLRVYGRPVKVHLEVSVALAAEGPQSMMPWQGNPDIMIDRFDVRADLDYINEKISSPEVKSKEEQEELRKVCYERYRVLVQNECAGVNEEQYLHQLYMDEQFGAIDLQLQQQGKAAAEAKKRSGKEKAAIGFVYEDSTPDVDSRGQDVGKEMKTEEKEVESEEEEEDDDILSDDEIDLDMALDVDMLTEDQTQMLNTCATQYGMDGTDYVDALRNDKEEEEALRLAKILEEEKAQFSGRKSRRERRAYKERKLQGRQISPPSYAAPESPKAQPAHRGSSSSRSRSPSPKAGGVQFITSFGGGSSDEEGQVVHGPSLPPHLDIAKGKKADSPSDILKNPPSSKAKPGSSPPRKIPRDASHPPIKVASSSHTRSKSRSYSRSYSRSRSRSRSRTRYATHPRLRRSRSRSRSHSKYHSGRSSARSRSPIRGSRSYRSRSRSRQKNCPRDSKRSRSTSRSSRSRSRSRSSSYSSTSRSRSRSSSRSRRSWSSSDSTSRSRSRSRSRYDSRSKSSSNSPHKTSPMKRYRRDSLSTSSSQDFSEEEDSLKDEQLSDKKSSANSPAGNAAKSAKGARLRMQDKLRRRMQAALNKQYKMDKRAELEKHSKIEQERQDREEELRAMAIQMRRREREKRHREREEQDVWSVREESSGDREGHSRSRSAHRHEATRRVASYRRRTKSKSKSPPREKRSRQDERHTTRPSQGHSSYSKGGSREASHGLKHSEDSKSKGSRHQADSSDRFRAAHHLHDENARSRSRSNRPLVDY